MIDLFLSLNILFQNTIAPSETFNIESTELESPSGMGNTFILPPALKLKPEQIAPNSFKRIGPLVTFNYQKLIKGAELNILDVTKTVCRGVPIFKKGSKLYAAFVTHCLPKQVIQSLNLPESNIGENIWFVGISPLDIPREFLTQIPELNEEIIGKIETGDTVLISSGMIPNPRIATVVEVIPNGAIIQLDIARLDIEGVNTVAAGDSNSVIFKSINNGESFQAVGLLSGPKELHKYIYGAQGKVYNDGYMMILDNWSIPKIFLILFKKNPTANISKLWQLSQSLKKQTANNGDLETTCLAVISTFSTNQATNPRKIDAN